MYFLNNTLLNSLLLVPSLALQVVYWLTCALLGKFWEHLNPPPATPITGLLELICHTNNHCYTGCNSETYAIRFSMHQLIFWPNFRIIDQYLVLVWADMHLFLATFQQYSSSIISVLRCNAPNVLKISLFIFKTCKKLNKGFRFTRLWYIWHPPLFWGEQASHTPPELKFLISPLRSWDQCNFIYCCKLSILWKFEQDWTTLRGVLGWSGISLYPRHLHSQYMYFGLNMYFLNNTLLNSLLLVPSLALQVVYWLTCALLGKFWEHLNPPPATPITGLLELICHTNNHCYTGCNSETYAIRFSMHQLIFWPNFRIIDQYLVLVWADMHLFLATFQQYSSSIISVLRCFAPNVLKISLFISKTCKKLNKGFRFTRLWYIWHPLFWGEQASHTPRNWNS